MVGPRQRKRVLCVRLGERGYAHVAERAARGDVTLSHMARRMLEYAAANMPDGWVPRRDYAAPARSGGPR